MAEQRYYVVGGEYADTSFTNPAPGIELEKHGPFSEAQARIFWQGVTGRSVDNAMVRYFLKPVDEAAGKAYWVVGGEYADSHFSRLAPARELEVFGPFEEREALGFWRGLTAKSADDALVRYEIRKDYTPAAKVAISAPSLRVRTKTKSVAIAALPAKVFAYLADAHNWSHWAIHNIEAVTSQTNGSWVVQTPRGRGSLKFRFDERAGILDHDFTDADGTAWTVPSRLIPTSGGSIVIMTFLKPLPMSESDFATAMAQVDEELVTLRQEIEAK